MEPAISKCVAAGDVKLDGKIHVEIPQMESRGARVRAILEQLIKVPRETPFQNKKTAVKNPALYGLSITPITVNPIKFGTLSR